MTAEHAILSQILQDLKTNEPSDIDDPIDWPEIIDEDSVPKLLGTIKDHNRLYDWLNQSLEEFRAGSHVEVSNPSFGDTYSRHYEARRVARQLDDGRWVGWIYWYGGGKHGNPEEIPWIEDAVFLNCVEEQKLVTVRTFSLSN